MRGIKGEGGRGEGWEDGRGEVQEGDDGNDGMAPFHLYKHNIHTKLILYVLA